MNKTTPENEPEMKQKTSSKRKQVLKFIIFLGLGVAVIWWFQQKLSPEEISEVKESFTNADYYLLGIALFFMFMSHVFRALRWEFLLSTFHPKTKFINRFFAVMVGYFANSAVPRLGEIIRCTLMQKYEKIPVEKSLGTVVSERLLDLFLFSFFFILGFILKFEDLQIYFYSKFGLNIFSFLWIGGIALIVVALGFVVAWHLSASALINRFPTKLKNIIQGFLEGIFSLKSIKKPWAFVAYSFGIWLCYLGGIYFTILSVSASAHLGIGAALIALCTGTIGIVLTPGGLGVYPVIIAETLQMFGLANTIGYAIGWLNWGIQTIMIMGLGALGLCVLPWVNQSEE